MVPMYKSIVPHLEYAALVWQSGRCKILDRVLRRGFAVCLGVATTASLDALSRGGTGPQERRLGSQRVWGNLHKTTHSAYKAGT